MKTLFKQKGFTLIEIIVVLIILGILVSLAVTSYFSWIRRCQAAEALMIAKGLKDTYGTCIQFHNGQAGVNIQTVCQGVWDNFQLSSNFSITPTLWGMIGPVAYRWGAVIYRNDNPGDYFQIEYFADGSGRASCIAQGNFAGLC